MTKTVIGLTGGIASGKSTITRYLVEKGYTVIDADALVHKLQEKGGLLYQALVEHYGTEILDDSKELDRAKLASIIFSSPETLKDSSELQDGIIREAIIQAKNQALEEDDFIFLDIPLLFEKGYEVYCNTVWLVDVTEEVQLQRLKERNGYNDEEARQRIASQSSLEQKRQKADVCIDNNGRLEDTYQQVEQLLRNIMIG